MIFFFVKHDVGVEVSEWSEKVSSLHYLR